MAQKYAGSGCIDGAHRGRPRLAVLSPRLGSRFGMTTLGSASLTRPSLQLMQGNYELPSAANRSDDQTVAGDEGLDPGRAGEEGQGHATLHHDA